jgi:hypothetical protein
MGVSVMKARPVALAMILLATAPSRVSGQAVDSQRVVALAGCWAVTTGDFTGPPVDSGMTTLPSIIELDTMPGKDIFGRRSEWLALGHPSTGASRYRSGTFAPMGSDSVRISWSISVVGLEINARVKADMMDGVAIAWTDYGGEQRAPITLRRAGCA